MVTCGNLGRDKNVEIREAQQRPLLSWIRSGVAPEFPDDDDENKGAERGDESLKEREGSCLSRPTSTIPSILFGLNSIS